MPTFGVEIENTKELKEFVSRTNEALSGTNLVSNPFTGRIIESKDLIVVKMDPIYFNPTPYVWIIVVTLLYLVGWRWWSIFPMIIGSCWIFWTKYFLYFALKIGLRKKGYRGKIKMITSAEVIRKVLFS